MATSRRDQSCRGSSRQRAHPLGKGQEKGPGANALWYSWRRRAKAIEASGADAHINEDQLVQALRGMPYPARRWQLLSWADFNGAAWMVIPTVSALPEREYADFEEVCREALPRYAEEIERTLVLEGNAR